ncbi:hypothetical protein BJ912DRAFT_1144320 [Pholiota molesta]|nr:hypothetical protein BJ912DRAFT_1144320 [Pholiota molesta]
MSMPRKDAAGDNGEWDGEAAAMANGHGGGEWGAWSWKAEEGVRWGLVETAGHAPLGSPSRRVFPQSFIPWHSSLWGADLDGRMRVARAGRRSGGGGASGSDAKLHQHPTSPLPPYPPSCSRQRPQHLCSTTTPALDIEGMALRELDKAGKTRTVENLPSSMMPSTTRATGSVGVRLEPPILMLASVGISVGGVSTMEMTTTATSAGHPGA